MTLGDIMLDSLLDQKSFSFSFPFFLLVFFNKCKTLIAKSPKNILRLKHHFFFFCVVYHLLLNFHISLRYFLTKRTCELSGTIEYNLFYHKENCKRHRSFQKVIIVCMYFCLLKTMKKHNPKIFAWFVSQMEYYLHLYYLPKNLIY